MKLTQDSLQQLTETSTTLANALGLLQQQDLTDLNGDLDLLAERLEGLSAGGTGLNLSELGLSDLDPTHKLGSNLQHLEALLLLLDLRLTLGLPGSNLLLSLRGLLLKAKRAA